MTNMCHSNKVNTFHVADDGVRTFLIHPNVEDVSISEFGVRGAKHCGKAALRPSGIKLIVLTLAPMEVFVKSSSRKLNHNLFTISALGHHRCDPKVSYFSISC